MSYVRSFKSKRRTEYSAGVASAARAGNAPEPVVANGPGVAVPPRRAYASSGPPMVTAALTTRAAKPLSPDFGSAPTGPGVGARLAPCRGRGRHAPAPSPDRADGRTSTSAQGKWPVVSVSRRFKWAGGSWSVSFSLLILIDRAVGSPFSRRCRVLARHWPDPTQLPGSRPGRLPKSPGIAGYPA